MAIVLKNAILVDLDPPGVEHGELHVEDGRIAARGRGVPQRGMSSLTAGVRSSSRAWSMATRTCTHRSRSVCPRRAIAPTNFREILEPSGGGWTALDTELIEVSARIGALDAIRCGTTAMIDHHASPNCIAGSLDAVEQGAARRRRAAGPVL